MREIWKWNPISTYDIPAMERWLGEMAAKGLLFKGIFGPWARFANGAEHPGRRYRLDVNPNMNERSDDEMLELYEQAGWTFVKKIWRKEFFVYYTDDPQAVESFTDSQSRALSLSEVVKKTKLSFLLTCFTFFLLAASFLFFYSPYRFLPDAKPMVDLMLPVMWLLNLIYMWRTFHALRQMQRWLEAGRPMEGFQMPPKRSVLNRTYWIIFLVFILVSFGEILIPGWTERTVPILEARTDFPILSLAQMEGDGYRPDPYRVEHTIPDTDATHVTVYPKFWEHNFVRTNWLPLSPRCWSIEQSGILSGREVFLEIQRYEMIFDRLVLPTLEGLSRWEKNLEKVQAEGADYFWTADGGDTVYAARGNVVLKVRYRGDASLSEYYEEIAAMLAGA